MDGKAHQVGGILLLLASLAGVAAGAVHPVQAGPLADIAGLGIEWRLSQVAMAIAGPLFILSTLFLARPFAEAPGEGWALLGAGCLLLGGVALTGVAAWNLSALLALQGGGSLSPESTMLGGPVVLNSMVRAAGILFPISVLAYGVAMVKNSSWTPWLAWAGVTVGLASLAPALIDIPLGAMAALPLVLGHEWLAIVGVVFARKSRAVAASDRAPVVAQTDAEKERSPEKPVVASIAQVEDGEAVEHSERVPEDLLFESDEPTRRDHAFELDPNGYPAEPVSTEAGVTEQLYARPGEALGRTSDLPSWPVRFEFVMDEDEEDDPAPEPRDLSRVAMELQSRAFQDWLRSVH